MSVRVWASSAENGSSMSSTAGSTASARAMPTRWRMPPDSWCGYLSSKPSSPVMAMNAPRALGPLRRGAAPAPRGRTRRSLHRAPRKQRELLEDRRRERRGRRRRSPSKRPRPRRRQKPGDDAEQRRLAAAGRPEHGDELLRLSTVKLTSASAGTLRRWRSRYVLPTRSMITRTRHYPPRSTCRRPDLLSVEMFARGESAGASPNASR